MCHSLGEGHCISVNLVMIIEHKLFYYYADNYYVKSHLACFNEF